MGKDSKLAISDSICASFAEAKHSTVKSKDSYFHTSSSPVEANNSKPVQFVTDNSTSSPVLVTAELHEKHAHPS